MHPKTQLQQDLKAAMRAGDVLRKSVIRMAMSAIKNAEIDKQAPLTEDEAMRILQSEAKKRRDSIIDYEKAGRADMVEQEKAELAIIETYLPKQLSRAEISAEAQTVIDEVGATGMKDMGKVMRLLMPRFDGRADGKLVNQIVRELLA